ncbi:BQ5605_C009g05654 [Microbotryum silenes-dioicae]|uniref:BQ5605_C009g05654 protein n=1 Tax=Microbotryum silenes-dioicae TaxID=796604 RepID=A0A2X0ME19_9BASI|nr:BQ5605_C009g05654 [Microbotryum silenes-dioicae]
MAMLKKKGSTSKSSRSKKALIEDENQAHPGSMTMTTTSIKATVVLTQHNTSSSSSALNSSTGGGAGVTALRDSTGNTPLGRHKSLGSNGKTPTTIQRTATTAQQGGGGGLSSIHLMAMWENFQLEAEAQKRALKKKERSRLDTFKRHIASTITQLDPRLRALPLERAIDEFENDLEKALRAIVLDELNAQQQSLLQSASGADLGGGTTTEKGGRKRKRLVGTSPTRPTHLGSDAGPDLSSSTNLQGSIKKARSTASTSAAATLGLGMPSSSRKLHQAPSQGVRSVSGKRTISAHGSPSTTAPRQTRATARSTRPETTWRLRPSTTSSTSFIHNPNLPQTPHGLALKSGQQQGQARAPRRGESILMRSVNDSPLLGELVADDSEEGEQEEEEDGDEYLDTEWSMVSPPLTLPSTMNGKTAKNKTKDKDPKGKRKASSSSVVPPSQQTFRVDLPANAPMYTQEEARKVREQVEREVRERMVEDLRKKLDATVLEKGERERLLGVLNQL